MDNNLGRRDSNTDEGSVSLAVIDSGIPSQGSGSSPTSNQSHVKFARSNGKVLCFPHLSPTACLRDFKVQQVGYDMMMIRVR